MQQYNLLLEIPKMNKCNSKKAEHEMCMLHDPLYFEIVLEEGTCLEDLRIKLMIFTESGEYYTENNKK